MTRWHHCEREHGEREERTAPGSPPAVILLQIKTKTTIDKTMDGKKLSAGDYIMSVISESKTASILFTIK